MNTPRRCDLASVWRWTLEMFSIVMVVCYWSLTFSGSIWGSGLRYRELFDGSFPVIGLLFVTSVYSWKKHRWHAFFGLVIFGAWFVWAALPRF